MEPLLLLVTIVALVLGAAMSLVAWRLLRHQREHSAARVEALQAMASADEAEDVADEGEIVRHAAARSSADVPAAAAPVHTVPAASPAAARFAGLDDAPLDRMDAAVAAAEPVWDAMRAAPARGAVSRSPPSPQVAIHFGAADEPRAPGRRWIALAGVAAVMILGAGVGYGAMATDMFAAIGRATTASASGAAAASAEPLQLLSLKHATDETGTFVLTGLVQNPASGRPLRGVVAVVYLFDQQGRYFAGGKTSIEVTALHPGEESPFVVRVPDATGVARYRVGFRLQDGGVVAHVDRRGQPQSGETVEGARDGVDEPIATPLAPMFHME